MDPITLLLSAGKTLGDLASTLAKSKDEHLKNMAELAKGQVELIRMQIEFLARENESLQAKLAEQEGELTDLREKIAVFEVSNEFEHGEDGLLYKKTEAGREGPYCPICRMRTVRVGSFTRCPRCDKTLKAR